MKKRFSKLYTIVAVLVCVFAMASTAYGAFTLTSFSGTITHPTGTYRTPGVSKSDNSSGYVQYISGNSSYVRVEMWGSDGTSGDYKNFTVAHTEGTVSGAKYYEIKKGECTMLPNTVYEYYNKKVYSSLLLTGYATGNISGNWSPTTK